MNGGYTQQQAEGWLDIIGWVDIIVAILVLVRPRSVPVLAWMTFWGLITAMSRMTCWGWTGFDIAFMRFMHGGMPLVLLLLVLFTQHRRENGTSKAPFSRRSSSSRSSEEE